MNATSAIAGCVIRDALRTRLTYLLLAFGLAILLFGVVASQLTMGWPVRLIADTCLTTIAFVASVLAIALGSSVIPKELQRRTIQTIAAKPVQRDTILIGSFVGAFGTIVMIVASMAVLSMLLLAAFSHTGGIHYPLVDYSLTVALIVLRSLVVLSVGVAVSTVAGTPVSAMVATAFAIGGYFSATTRDLLSLDGDPLQSAIGSAIYYVLPDSTALDGLERLIYGEPLLSAATGGAAIYAIAYSVCVLALGCLAFRKRDLI